jgi:uncharacterized membrane protein
MEFFSRLARALFEVHPVHTMVVHFPIALTIAALIFILLALWRRSRPLEQAAYFNLALAAVTTVLTGLTGLWDNQEIYDGVAPNAVAKIVLGIALLLLTTVTTLWRRQQPELLWQPNTRPLYVASFVVGAVLVAILGFLGGVILYGF